MIFRCILPDWAKEENQSLPKVQEGEFSPERIEELNKQGYNIYWLPNSPTEYVPGHNVDGADIDHFDFVFIDMDLKEHKHESKEAFIDLVLEEGMLNPTLITDSGNGIHVYWAVSDLGGLDFLRLQRRLCRRYVTDEAVSKIYQLMRFPGTMNTKVKDDLKLCQTIY